MVEEETPGEVERIDVDVALARLRPDDEERRAGPVFPSEHGVGLKTAEGEVVLLGLGVQGRERVAVLEQREVIIAAFGYEQLTVELDRQRGGDRDVAAEGKVE